MLLKVKSEKTGAWTAGPGSPKLVGDLHKSLLCVAFRGEGRGKGGVDGEASGRAPEGAVGRAQLQQDTGRQGREVGMSSPALGAGRAQIPMG